MSQSKNHESKAPTRREFIQSTALLGGAGIATALGAGCAASGGRPQVDYDVNEPEKFIYSVCLQCHTDCPIKVKLEDGTISKIDGNPYSIQTFNPAIPYVTPLRSGGRIDGAICPKGQAGIQSQYDPYRIVKVLKRAGKRGENKWEVIEFSQAIREIVQGGKNFSKVPGEENRRVPGLAELYRLRDPDLSKKLADAAARVGKGEMSVAEFKRKFRDHLDLLIDPDHPDFGPKNNQFVFQAGRIEHGRKEFSKRFVNGAFGSINWYEHTSICEQSHHIAYDRATAKLEDGKWGGGKHHMKPDFYNSRFVVFFGTGAFEANFGPPYLTNLVTNGQIDGELEYAVVDPRLSKTAAKAWKWLPVRPGGDGALVYGMIRWILENERFDRRFLESANKAAAKAANETTWSDASWLVRIEKDGPGKNLRAADIGLGDDKTFVTTRGGKPVAFDPNDGDRPITGDLFFDGEINGIRVKSALQIVKDYAFSKSLEEWSKESGIDVDDIVAVAREFTRHGKRAVAEMYRGPVQHTSGCYNGQAIIALNTLVGNADWKGGLTKGGGHWHEDGSKKGQPFPVGKGLHPGKLKAFGIRVNREKQHYESSTLFREEGYPARRPWFPHTGNVYQEIIPSIADRYPYGVKALMIHKGTPVFAAPGGHRVIQALADPNTVPLLMACDIVIGETSMYADYIFPDTSIWERWGTPHITPACPVAQSKVRQPAVDPVVETVKVFGREMPCSLEAVMLALAEALGLPGYGAAGFGPGMPFTHPQDYFLKMVANIAAGDKPGDVVPDASKEEQETFVAARRHLRRAAFDLEAAPEAVTDAEGRNWWPKVVYVLNRGGRFEDFDRYRRSGDRLPHPYKGMFRFYVEEVAQTRHPYTGERFSGIGLSLPVRGYDGKDVVANAPLELITYKEIVGGQSRTAAPDYWLSAILGENRVLMAASTAAEKGLKDGQLVRLVAPDNPEGHWDLHNGEKIPMEGRLSAVQGMRPGVVAVSWSYGHWAYGSADVVIDGQRVPGDPGRRRGLCPNAAMAIDPTLENVGLEDLIGGSASFFDSRVDVVPV